MDLVFYLRSKSHQKWALKTLISQTLLESGSNLLVMHPLGQQCQKLCRILERNAGLLRSRLAENKSSN